MPINLVEMFFCTGSTGFQSFHAYSVEKKQNREGHEESLVDHNVGKIYAYNLNLLMS